jgi:hypothetical protein
VPVDYFHFLVVMHKMAIEGDKARARAAARKRRRSS